MLRFYALRVAKDYLGHLILIGLPIFFITVLTYINTSEEAPQALVASHIAIIFILMFQIFGAAYTFEGLQEDFMTAKKDRLLATPVSPMKLVVCQIFFSIMISMIQTLLVIAFTIVVYNADYGNLIGILGFLLLSSSIAQLLGGVILLTVKKASKAQAIITIYAIAAPMVAGLNFQLPDHSITPYLERYSSHLSLAFIGIEGVIEQNMRDVMIGLISLSVLLVILMVLLKQFSRRVII